MTRQYLIFNGDTDGICSAHQFQLAYPADYNLVTGVKRDNSLLKKIADYVGIDSVTVFDIAIEKNLPELKRLLFFDVPVRWFDHHFSEPMPEHDLFTCTIDTDAKVNTAYLVAKELRTFSAWTVMGLCGDNIFTTAEKLAEELKLTGDNYLRLKEAGELINYNGYGGSLEDLHFHPAELLKQMKPFQDALEFLENTDIVPFLRNGMNEDLAKAETVNPVDKGVYLFPDEKWSRRVIGVFANRKANEETDKAHAVLVEKSDGKSYAASVRSPLTREQSAAEFCKQFPTGGGRMKAAGINELPKEQLTDFSKRFAEFFSQ